LGIGFVPYSPLGRGFLTGQIRLRADLDAIAPAAGDRYADMSNIDR
jgi:aryl-alcohol dehydrogenase-like predicted oxidoreductase